MPDLQIYVPDFDAKTAGTGRLLRISADAYNAAIRMGHADSIMGTRHVKKVQWPVEDGALLRALFVESVERTCVNLFNVAELNI